MLWKLTNCWWHHITNSISYFATATSVNQNTQTQIFNGFKNTATTAWRCCLPKEGSIQYMYIFSFPYFYKTKGWWAGTHNAAIYLKTYIFFHSIKHFTTWAHVQTHPASAEDDLWRQGEPKWVVNRSTSAFLNHVKTCSTTVRWRLHSSSRGSPLYISSAPLLMWHFWSDHLPHERSPKRFPQLLQLNTIICYRIPTKK